MAIPVRSWSNHWLERRHPIIYKGIYQGKAYEDKGNVLKVEPEKLLLITHWSPLSGSADTPENYHKVSYDLAAEKDGTLLTITQDNNATKEEQEQNSKFWKTVLDSIKKLLEGWWEEEANFDDLNNASPLAWSRPKRLDEAVFAAYGWKSDLSDEEILEKLLALNLERSRWK